MVYSVTWSPKSRISYLNILEYLEEKWTIKEIRAFIDRVDELVLHISSNPLHYPYSKDSDSYKCVVVKQVSLFYRLKQGNIELLIFWDNRQNPAKLAL